MSAGQYDPRKVNRDLGLLAPKFREAVTRAVQECNQRGLDAYVYEAYRSPELQAAYYARGRTEVPPVKPVTNAKTNLFSWHGYGLAVDVISRSKGWNQPDSWFEQVAEIFLEHDCKWGGKWKARDLPHFQWHLCKPSPSDRARELLRTGGVIAVWQAVGAVEGPNGATSPTTTTAAPGVSAGNGATAASRVLFERAPQGSRTVRGGLIAKIQARLHRDGYDVGTVDGVYGGDTERALTEWQRRVGARPTGQIDVQTWFSLVSPQLPSMYERALQLTAAFEGHGFGTVAGNFDKAWLTWGIIGFNLRMGALGALLKEIRRDHPAVFRAAFAELESELVTGLESAVADKEAWCNRISIAPDRRKVLPAWKNAFEQLGATSEAQSIQLRYAEHYWRLAQRDADRFDLRSELGHALCFDIAVQNGGVSEEEEERILKKLKSRPPAGEEDVRVTIANVVAEASKPEYVEDVRSRKLAIATGAGEVHGARYELRGWGIADAKSEG